MTRAERQGARRETVALTLSQIEDLFWEMGLDRDLAHEFADRAAAALEAGAQ